MSELVFYSHIIVTLYVYTLHQIFMSSFDLCTGVCCLFAATFALNPHIAFHQVCIAIISNVRAPLIFADSSPYLFLKRFPTNCENSH